MWARNLLSLASSEDYSVHLWSNPDYGDHWSKSLFRWPCTFIKSWFRTIGRTLIPIPIDRILFPITILIESWFCWPLIESFFRWPLIESCSWWSLIRSCFRRPMIKSRFRWLFSAFRTHWNVKEVPSLVPIEAYWAKVEQIHIQVHLKEKHEKERPEMWQGKDFV